MSKIEVTLTFDDEKLEALEFYLRKENGTVQKRMDEALRKLYEEMVPEVVREFVDRKAAAAARDRSRRSAPKPAPAKPQVQTQPNIPTQGEDTEK